MQNHGTGHMYINLITQPLMPAGIRSTRESYSGSHLSHVRVTLESRLSHGKLQGFAVILFYETARVTAESR